jgi:hypothetical protein
VTVTRRARCTVRVRSLVVGVVLAVLATMAVPALAAAAYPVNFASAQSIDGTNFMRSIDCPSVSFCVAGDAQGYVLESGSPTSAGSWHATYLPAGASVVGISCPSTSDCVAVDGDGNAWTSSNPAGGSWTKVPSITSSFDGVSCPSSSICVAVGQSGGAFVSTNGGAAWGGVAGTSSDMLDSVSCPSTALCVAVGYNRKAITLTNLAAGAGASVATDATADSQSADDFNAVACASASVCVGVDSSGYAAVSTNPLGPVWDPAVLTGSSGALNAIACPLTTMCVAVDGNGDATFTTDPGDGASSTWSTAETGFDSHQLQAVACPQTGLCFALDSEGGASVGTGAALNVSLAGGGGGTVSDSDSYISCGTTCSADYAAGSQVTLTAAAGPASVFTGWSGACSGTGSCVVTNGLAGSSQSVTATFEPPAPVTTITKATINRRHHSARFAFTATNSPSAFECALVRKPRPTKHHRHPKTPLPHYATCTSARSYRSLKRGSFTFYVYAVGPGGTEQTPVTDAFKIP